MEEVPWLGEPPGAQHWANGARLGKNPVVALWRSAGAPVWNHWHRPTGAALGQRRRARPGDARRDRGRPRRHRPPPRAGARGPAPPPARRAGGQRSRACGPAPRPTTGAAGRRVRWSRTPTPCGAPPPATSRSATPSPLSPTDPLPTARTRTRSTERWWSTPHRGTHRSGRAPSRWPAPSDLTWRSPNAASCVGHPRRAVEQGDGSRRHAASRTSCRRTSRREGARLRAGGGPATTLWATGFGGTGLV